MTFKIPAVSTRTFILACCLLAFAGNASAWSAPQQSVKSFQREVKKRFAKDQSARIQMLKISNKAKPLTEKDHTRHQRLAQRAIDVDAANVKWLKNHVSEFGLPDPALLGSDTSERLFVILIHADRDRNFQKRCVELMEASPDEWPATYAQRLKTRMVFTAPLKLEQFPQTERSRSSQ